MRLVEIRSYRLAPGSAEAFDELVSRDSAPLHRKFGIDLVAHGPSADDADCYFLIRAFRDLDDLRRSQERLYVSPEWRTGPREAIVTLIVADSNVVLPLNSEAVESLRRSLAR